jgi:hypothetical protein
MSKNITCVLREVGGSMEYVPVNEVPFLRRDDRVFVGPFNSHEEKHGPSGSHTRTVCTPAGQIIEGSVCVIREVSPGDSQFRPVADVDARVLNNGERAFAGCFRTTARPVRTRCSSP